MKKEWEVVYENWLTSDQMEDTPERREAFSVGWEWGREDMQEDIKRILR